MKGRNVKLVVLEEGHSRRGRVNEEGGGGRLWLRNIETCQSHFKRGSRAGGRIMEV
jgi:hypothetical protein